MNKVQFFIVIELFQTGVNVKFTLVLVVLALLAGALKVTFIPSCNPASAEPGKILEMKTPNKTSENKIKLHFPNVIKLFLLRMNFTI